MRSFRLFLAVSCALCLAAVARAELSPSDDMLLSANVAGIKSAALRYLESFDQAELHRSSTLGVELLGDSRFEATLQGKLPHVSRRRLLLRAGDAYLTLYAVGADRRFLAAATRIGESLLPLLRSSPPAEAFVEREATADFLLLLSYYSGRATFLKAAKVARPAITDRPPLHLTVVGQKGSPDALALFQRALQYPEPFKRTEWWDTREGPMPSGDVDYPELPIPAAFVCSDARCSLPITEPAKLHQAIEALLLAEP